MPGHGWGADGITMRWSLTCPCGFCETMRVAQGWVEGARQDLYANTGMSVLFTPPIVMGPKPTTMPARHSDSWLRAQRLLCSRLTTEQIGCVVINYALPVRSAYDGCYLIPVRSRGPPEYASTVFARHNEWRVRRVEFNRRGFPVRAQQYCVYHQGYSTPPGDGLYSMMRLIETDPIAFRAIAVRQWAVDPPGWLTRGVFDRICPKREKPLRIGPIDRWLRMMFGNLSTE